MGKEISAEFPFESRYLEVKGSNIHYIEEGEGEPILFLHGAPTSNYLWRNVIPHVSNRGRCIAPDLIGMGKSDKPDIDYGFNDSYEYLDAFIKQLDLKNITLVLHDWGSGLGFHYANLNRENVKAIAFMESMTKTFEFSQLPLDLKIAMKMMRAPILGWLMVNVANIFIRKMIPDLVSRELTKKEKEVYASPYPTISSRKPLRAWPKSVPFGGKPKVTYDAITNYLKWLKETDIPKLFLYVEPGIAIIKEDVERIKTEWKNLKTVFLGEGLHFIQEDYPHEIGNEISEWYNTFEK